MTQIEVYPNASTDGGQGFTFNGITRYDKGAYDLVGGEKLSDAGTWPKASVAEPLRGELLQLCRQRLDAFRMQRSEEVLGGDGLLGGVNT